MGSPAYDAERRRTGSVEREGRGGWWVQRWSRVRSGRAGTQVETSLPPIDPVMAQLLPDEHTAVPLGRPPAARPRATVRLAPESAVEPEPSPSPSPPLSVWSVIVGSRVLLLLVGYVAVARRPLAPYMQRLIYDRTVLLPGAAGRWLDAWTSWDGQWYLRIARLGYQTVDATAFFPLYPLLVRVVAAAAGQAYVVAAVGTSLACYVVAMYLLYRLVVMDYGPRVAAATVVFASLFPVSFFYQTAYSESVFLLTTVACVFFARRGQWLAAGVAGFFAALTRNTGFLVVLPMGLFYLQARGWRLRRIDARLVWFALVPAGLALWMGYLGGRFGDVLAFSRAEVHWHRHLTAPWTTVVDGVRAGAAGLTAVVRSGASGPTLGPRGNLVIPIDLPNALALLALILAAVVLGLSARRLKLPYAAYGVASLLAPLFYPTERQPLYSMPRFVLVIFPVFIGLALLTRRVTATRVALLAGSTFALVLLTTLFLRFWFVA